MHFINRLVFIIFLSLLISCNSETTIAPAMKQAIDKSSPVIALEKDNYEPSEKWKAYWYAGKAEITSYTLMQSRYGEIHEGNLVNIFVTEDFSKQKQVKLDEPEETGKSRVKILKLNQSLKFVTGIYPYSLMLSVFSPVDINRYPHPVKITASAQEWCGMSFFQLNNRNNKMVIEQRSYFEKENDQDISMLPVIAEDALWNIMRIDPAKLPQGEQQVLPGALYLRLSHKPLTPVKTQLNLLENDSNYIYTITYPSLSRTLTITIEKLFPYGIIGWSDAYPGIDGKLLTSTVSRRKTILSDYWKRHGVIDRKLRAELELPVDTQ